VPLGMEVGLDPSDIVLDGYTQLPFPKGDRALDFRPCLLWLNGCMDEDATGMEVGLGPGHIVVDGDPAPLPNFRSMFVVSKRRDRSRFHPLRR